MDDARRNALKVLLNNMDINTASVSEGSLKLYDQALTHSSYAKEMQDKNIGYRDNERLEFLGNFVLGLVVSEYLYNEFNYSEGEMTKRMEVVSDAKLAEIIRKKRLGFDKGYIQLGKRSSHHRKNLEDSILAGAVEAFIGAIYLDLGMEEAKTMILELLCDEINNFDPGRNYIGRLQELVQKDKLGTLRYLETKLTGPDHRPTFSATVKVSGKVFGKGTGKSKKAAKMDAAKEALLKLEKNI